MPIHPRSLLARDRARRNPRTLAAPTAPALSEVVTLLKEWLTLTNAVAPDEVQALDESNVVEWLSAQTAAVQSKSANPDDVGAAGLSLALSGTVDAGRVRIARDVARRRGISLDAALKFVPK